MEDFIFDIIFPLFLLICVGFLGFLLFMLITGGGAGYANKFNDTFTQQCKIAGGVASIGDKDICFKNGVVLFQEQ
jgi:hypothetical protein